MNELPARILDAFRGIDRWQGYAVPMLGAAIAVRLRNC
jgi:hypothetical protein